MVLILFACEKYMFIVILGDGVFVCLFVTEDQSIDERCYSPGLFASAGDISSAFLPETPVSMFLSTPLYIPVSPSPVPAVPPSAVHGRLPSSMPLVPP